MRFYDGSVVVSETRALSVEAFARLHPHPGLVLEPFESGAAKRDTTTKLKLPQTEPDEAPQKIHARARISWLTPTSLALGGAPRWRDVTIGREAVCDIVLPHPSVSKLHAVLRNADGQWTIEDKGSTNGTTLNGQQLAAGQTPSLADGDVIVLGLVVMVRPYLTPAVLYALIRAHDSARLQSP
jgi:hypothetical protein